MVMKVTQEEKKTWIELDIGCVVEQEGSPVDGQAGERYRVNTSQRNYLVEFGRAHEVEGPHRKVAK